MMDAPRAPRDPTPIVDLFAGPGGLGEGFSRVRTSEGAHAFQVRLSIEKDPAAHRTLELRAIYRWLSERRIPAIYWQYLAGQANREELLTHPSVKEATAHAQQEARCAELGVTPESTINSWIKDAIGNREDWVLLGGPPCQAYSLVGRARQSRLSREEFEKDHRHLLYREYLRIVRTYRPAVFVMENVKGLLSATYEGQPIFERICADLSLDDRYQIRSFVVQKQSPDPRDFVIRAEDYGVPQARHRVILLGVRDDLKSAVHRTLTPQKHVSVGSVLKGMPRLRSRISTGSDSPSAWISELMRTREHLGALPDELRERLTPAIENALKSARTNSATGGRFVLPKRKSQFPRHPLMRWLRSQEPPGWLNHESRGHMPTDLQRYMFAAAYAQETGVSPRIMDFPRSLLPDHDNVWGRSGDSTEAIPFADRFRVQRRKHPSTTVVSHIAKDGHYFIHYDPAQARSLTVREAARLQTFPDNYFFEGNRTQQFTQVGNAVPPYLAYALGRIVWNLMNTAGARSSTWRRSTSQHQPK